MILICGHLIITVTCLTLATLNFSTWFLAIQVKVYDVVLCIHTDTWHVIHNTRHLTPVLDMSYLIPDPDTWYMIHASTHLARFHVVHGPDIVTPDRILLPLIHVLYGIFMTITFTGTWHDCYIVTRHLVLLNPCTPDSCIPCIHSPLHCYSC